MALSGIPVLAPVRKLATLYMCRVFNDGYPAPVCDVAHQVQNRIEQISYLMRCAGVLHYETQLIALGDVSLDPHGVQDQHYHFLLNLYGESFYYFAHHLQDVLVNGHLPFLEQFKPVRNITVVRNHLIEHAERGNITDIRGTTGGDFGIRFKDSRRRGQPREHRDNGLLQNAAALESALTAAFEHALNIWPES